MAPLPQTIANDLGESIIDVVCEFINTLYYIFKFIRFYDDLMIYFEFYDMNGRKF